jgi:hypothetical protein
MTCDTEGALGEREDLGGRYREHEDSSPTFEVKAVAACPSSVCTFLMIGARLKIE